MRHHNTFQSRAVEDATPTRNTLQTGGRVRGGARGNLLACGLALTTLLTGCAGTSGNSTSAAPGNVSGNSVTAKPSETAPLESVRGSLTTSEDSLILDLVLGYKMRTEGGRDPEALSRARSAQNQLEYMLRHGGVKERGGEGRVVTVDGDRLTLNETINQLSAALLRHTPGTPWRPEAERAREIQRRRPELSSLVEDAEWVLTLAAALEESGSNVSPDVKARLRRLHQTYASRAPHAEVAAQVNALLPLSSKDALRRELKKLANRSWERERRGSAALPVSALVTPTLSQTPSSPPVNSAVPPTDSAAIAASDESPDSPERFCAERRTLAAEAFAQARASADTEARTRHLRRSLEMLDECLTRYPAGPEADKARQNRARVEQELKR